MLKICFKQSWFVLFLVMIFGHEGLAQTDKEHVEVALRTIGHQVLLKSSDSTSRVLPINMEGDKCIINFAGNFAFEPSELRSTVENVFAFAHINNTYRLQVRNRDTKEIVYSYEVASNEENSLTPCKGRPYPKGNYDILISLMDDQGAPVSFVADSTKSEETVVTRQAGNSQLVLLIIVSLALASIVAIYFWRRKQPVETKVTHHAHIGKYQFDERNMKLIYNDESIDLTSKETDLLALLHSSVDQTIEREKILEVVWGDEGDYVGRTLDVFISKLRKKFSQDENVRIVNVRGVGYRLMCEVS